MLLVNASSNLRALGWVLIISRRASSNRIHLSQVCHTDLHAALGDWPLPAKTPLVGGHEGVGEVVAIGNNTSHSPVKVGDRVGVKWLADS